MKFLILISCGLILFYSAYAKESSHIINGTVTENNLTFCSQQTPYKLSVKLAGNTFHSGDSIILKIAVENKSLNDIFIIQSDLIRDYDFKLTDSADNSIELKSNWRQKLIDPKSGSQIATYISPSTVFTKEIELTDLFDLPAGRYSIAIENFIYLKNQFTTGIQVVKLKSEPIKINIK